jgi:hypothetical protein
MLRLDFLVGGHYQQSPDCRVIVSLLL